MPERVTIKRVRIPFAENLRFPGEGKSAQGESGPKARPKGVADGRQVNIPAPLPAVDDIRTCAGKAIPLLDGGPARARALMTPKSQEAEPRKAPRRLNQAARTKTDTGRREEYSQALERTLAKELGNLTP